MRMKIYARGIRARRPIRWLLIPVFVFAILGPMALTPGGGEALAQTKDCVADPTWFPKTPRPMGRAFPGDPTNCDFHQWSWQMFLWLNERVSYGGDGPRFFEQMAFPQDLFTKSGKGPTMGYPGRQLGPDFLPQFLPRTGKSQDSIDVDAVFQAGPGAKILIDQKGQVVYYSIYLDKVFWDFITGEELYLLKNLQKVEKQNPELNFTVDSLELKASWRVVAMLDKETGKPTEVFIKDADRRFITIKANIPPVEIKDGKIVTGEPHKPAILAMVGFHVVGIVKNHHEFIWASFEHVDNAPICADLPVKQINPETGQSWSFYKGGTPASEANQFNENDPLSKVSACQLYPWGGGSEPNHENQKNIVALNKSVQTKLGGTNPVLANYFELGAEWTGGTIPQNNGAPFKSQIGSVNLANTSMETFTPKVNCFACHNGGAHIIAVGNTPTTVGRKNINLSFPIVNYQASQQVNPGK